MRRAPKVSKLCDEFGNYLLIIVCLGCGHEHRCEPGLLAAKVGWDCTFVSLERRLKCSKCGTKVSKLSATSHYERPTRWH